MRAPKSQDSLSWRKQKGKSVSTKDASIISAAVSGLNKFANDGNFMLEFNRLSSKNTGSSVNSHPNDDGIVDSEVVLPKSKLPSESTLMMEEELSANKLAAKAMQLRLKGMHAEADKLLQEVEKMKAKLGVVDNSTKHQDSGSSGRYVIHDLSVRKKKDDDDKYLAQKIMQNKQYSLSGRADDEYDFEDGPSRKSRKKREGNDNKGAERAIAKHILTQQERCLHCFENPNRPRHLVVALANYTYLMLPQWQAVVPGHCCILPMQHESAT